MRDFIERFKKKFNNIPVRDPVVGEKTPIYVMLQRINIVFFPFLLALFFIVGIFLYMKAYYKSRAIEFNGIIGMVWEGDRGTINIEIGELEYSLGTQWGARDKIEEGDSVIKRKGEMTIKVIKKGTGEVLYLER